MTVEKHASDWFVYLVRSCKGHLYCGITVDLDRRVKQHNDGTGAKALRGKGPITLEWSQNVGPSKSLASKVELKIKSFSKFKKEDMVLQQTQLALSLFE